MSDVATDIETLAALEAKRCAAISEGDLDTLRAMLTDDYVHVHMTGRLDDRAGRLEAVSQRPRRTECGELNVRVYGDLAVLTGEITNYTVGTDGESAATRAYCQRVAARQVDEWRFVSAQLTPLREG